MVLSIVVRLLVGAVALWITSLLAQQIGLPLKIESAAAAVLVVLALSLINALIRPVINLFTLPLRFATFGLIGFVINGLLFWSVSLLNIPGFLVGSFLAALFGSVAMGLVGGLLSAFVKVGK